MQNLVSSPSLAQPAISLRPPVPHCFRPAVWPDVPVKLHLLEIPQAVKAAEAPRWNSTTVRSRPWPA